MAGLDPISLAMQGASAIANLTTSLIQGGQYKKLAAQQQQKGTQLQAEANATKAENVLNDPAYQMKEALAKGGLPGYGQEKQNIDESLGNAIEAGKKTGRSGGELLSYIASMTGNYNQNLRTLDAQNDKFKTGEENELTEDRYNWQQHYDDIARMEKEKLNYAATQYENAATENKEQGISQQLTAVGGFFNAGAGIAKGAQGQQNFNKYVSAFGQKTDNSTASGNVAFPEANNAGMGINAPQTDTSKLDALSMLAMTDPALAAQIKGLGLTQ